MLVFVRWFLALVVEAEKDKEWSVVWCGVAAGSWWAVDRAGVGAGGGVGVGRLTAHSRIRVHFALETCAL